MEAVRHYIHEIFNTAGIQDKVAKKLLAISAK